MDLSIFFMPETWISLVTLIFLEIVLGFDNIAFIALTTNRLPENKQSLGRKLGLAGALLMRCLFLCFASWLIHMSDPLVILPFDGFDGEPFGLSIRDIVMLVGGIYLIYKGISEIRGVFDFSSDDEEESGKHGKLIGLPQAVATIMVMDIVFSIDSVITAVGLANQLVVMIAAVIIAVLFMMVFIDWISDFINRNVEMTILALVFITTIGLLLVCDSIGLKTGLELMGMDLEKVVIYFAMLFSLIMTLIQMAYKSGLRKWEMQRAASIKDETTNVEDNLEGLQ